MFEWKRSNSGYTLLEILLTIAVVGILAGLAIPVYQSFEVKNDLDLATHTIVQEVRRAQALSEASDGDSSWGAKIQNNDVTVFRGSSYAARDPQFDEVFSFFGTLTVSGLQEIVFEKFTGTPQSIGTTTLVSVTNESTAIVINSKGVVSY